jgi:hypothetical protein
VDYEDEIDESDPEFKPKLQIKQFMNHYSKYLQQQFCDFASEDSDCRLYAKFDRHTDQTKLKLVQLAMGAWFKQRSPHLRTYLNKATRHMVDMLQHLWKSKIAKKSIMKENFNAEEWAQDVIDNAGQPTLSGLPKGKSQVTVDDLVQILNILTKHYVAMPMHKIEQLYRGSKWENARQLRRMQTMPDPVEIEKASRAVNEASRLQMLNRPLFSSRF